MNSPYNSMIDVRNFDWNAIWQEDYLRRKSKKNQKEYWNKRAPSFAQHAEQSAYVTDFIGLQAWDRTCSVLDVGCGAGTLAVPLSKLVRQVTAIDFSDRMIELLGEKCRALAIDNVERKIVSWEDDWDQAGLKKHDVVVASRSLVAFDLRAALLKLDRMAKKRVIVSSIVGDGPFDPKIFEAIGRPLNGRLDYICVYNLLYQLGIFANVTFVTNLSDDKTYIDIDDAVIGSRWMINDMTAEEERKLRKYLQHQLVPGNDGLVFPDRHLVRWAIISWEKNGLC